VVWAPAVFKMAEDYGLKLLKGGKLIDTTLGDTVPAGAELEPPPSRELLQTLTSPPMEKMRGCCASGKALQANPKSPLAREGVEEAGVIVPVATDDGFQPGPIVGWWEHGFNVRRLTMQTGAVVPRHTRAEQEVIFVQDGTLEVSWSDGRIVMGAGDTLSVPVGLAHGFRNTASVPLIAFIVRGADNPQAPVFATKEMAAA
jgi:mannose-6-phosphate isomerase-like protein (cupin superfamily)